MVDKIINTVSFIAIIAVIAGILLAIWFGIIGLKIAASGIVAFAADCILYMIVKAKREEDDCD